MNKPIPPDEKLPDLVVTRGGVPVPDQAQGLRDFAAACQAKPAPALAAQLFAPLNMTTTLPGHPLAKLLYVLTETLHGPQFRIALGVPDLASAHDLVDWIYAEIKKATIAEPDDILQLAHRLAKTNKDFYGNGNVDLNDSIEMLVDCSDSIAALGHQLARLMDDLAKHKTDLASTRAELDQARALIDKLRPLAPLAFHVLEKAKS